ncbi:MAG: GTPase Era [Firmicutes bacterium]|nr:GTPase Era [candidate division NPL-UPA2 bacterium]MBT9155221.1 GTPase Era [candidate division NPL-UPA2 bacterium]
MTHKSGFVAVVGRPNVGKSTLLNRVLGEKILIVSDKPQTTRNKIRCIYTEQDLQAVFLDTPGIHKPHHRLGEQLVANALAALAEVDQIWFVVEPTERVGTIEREIISKLPKEAQTVLVVNKADTVPHTVSESTLAAFRAVYDFQAAFSVSAATGERVPELLEHLRATLPEGPQYYPEDMIIDQPERFVAAEIVREKVLELTRDEIPHSTAVVVEAMKEQGDIVHVTATVYVERESQKGIIIGKSGVMLKAIGTAARIDIESLLGSQIHLALWVKVRKDWRQKEHELKRLGYERER